MSGSGVFSANVRGVNCALQAFRPCSGGNHRRRALVRNLGRPVCPGDRSRGVGEGWRDATRGRWIFRSGTERGWAIRSDGSAGLLSGLLPNGLSGKGGMCLRRAWVSGVTLERRSRRSSRKPVSREGKREDGAKDTEGRVFCLVHGQAWERRAMIVQSFAWGALLCKGISSGADVGAHSGSASGLFRFVSLRFPRPRAGVLFEPRVHRPASGTVEEGQNEQEENEGGEFEVLARREEPLLEMHEKDGDKQNGDLNQGRDPGQQTDGEQEPAGQMGGDDVVGERPLGEQFSSGWGKSEERIVAFIGEEHHAPDKKRDTQINAHEVEVHVPVAFDDCDDFFPRFHRSPPSEPKPATLREAELVTTPPFFLEIR